MSTHRCNTVTDFYAILYKAIKAKGGETVSHGLDGYFFGEAGEYTALEVANEIKDALLKHSNEYSAEVKPFTSDDDPRIVVFGSNSRCRADHARSLGWSPKGTTKVSHFIRYR